jgi:hypothetical protein
MIDFIMQISIHYFKLEGNYHNNRTCKQAYNETCAANGILASIMV